MTDQSPEEKALAAAISRTLAARAKLAAAEHELTQTIAACRAADVPDDRIRRMTRKLQRTTSTGHSRPRQA